VMAASDRVICLNGHVCCHGTPEHVSSAPEYRALFGTGTAGALALYRHEHDHRHDGSPGGGSPDDGSPDSGAPADGGRDDTARGDGAPAPREAAR